MSEAEMRAKLDREIERTINRINKMSKNITPEIRKKCVRRGAGLVAKRVQSYAPTSRQEHYRYKKGLGKIAIQPGNLKRSIRVFDFKGTPDLFVGVALGRRAKVNDGYYAHMVEYGTRHFSPRPFFRPGLETSKGDAERVMVKDFGVELKKIAAPLRMHGIELVER